VGQFSKIVRERMQIDRALPVRANPELPAQVAGKTLQAGQRCLEYLTASIPACAGDERCKQAYEVLRIAFEQGTLADARTALTQLQTHLRELTEEDSDVAADLELQRFRKQLHLILDH